MMSKTPQFSRGSLSFLLKASRQKHPEWLERNHEKYESLLLEPLKHLAKELKLNLAKDAIGYHFPQKGIDRIKRSARSAQEHGGLYRDWLHYSAAVPRSSRFENNPSLYFLLNPTDRNDPVLLAGGLYMPSSRQLRAIRESIAQDATAFEQLFRSKEFSKHFKEGFSLEKTASRPPRGFDPLHPKLQWLKLQAYFVWKPYSMREFTSPRFSEKVVQDCRQILKLNKLLDQAIVGRLTRQRDEDSELKNSAQLSQLIAEVQVPQRKFDF